MMTISKWTAGLVVTLAIGLAGGVALADTALSPAKPDAKVVPVAPAPAAATTEKTPLAGKAITVHQAPTKASDEKKMHEFWKGLQHNSRLAWVANDLTVPVDTIESSTEIRLNAEMPGIDENTLDVTVSRDSVSIKGDKKIDTDQKAQDFRRLERAYGSFTKIVELPASVDSEKATATLHNGILTVCLPKSPASANEGKKLTIKKE